MSMYTSACDVKCLCGRRFEKKICEKTTHCDHFAGHPESEDGVDTSIIREGEDMYICFAAKPAHDYSPFECCEKCALSFNQNGPVFNIEAILEERLCAQTGEKEYLVKWENYANSEATWEPKEGISHSIPFKAWIQKDSMVLDEEDSDESLEDKDEYVVEAILDERKNEDSGSIELLVKWKDYPDSQSTWEPLSGVCDCDAYKIWKNKSKMKVDLGTASSRRSRRSANNWTCTPTHTLDKRRKMGKRIKCDGIDMGGCLSGEMVSKARHWACVNCNFNLCQPCCDRYRTENVLS